MVASTCTYMNDRKELLTGPCRASSLEHHFNLRAPSGTRSFTLAFDCSSTWSNTWSRTRIENKNQDSRWCLADLLAVHAPAAGETPPYASPPDHSPINPPPSCPCSGRLNWIIISQAFFATSKPGYMCVAFWVDAFFVNEYLDCALTKHLPLGSSWNSVFMHIAW